MYACRVSYDTLFLLLNIIGVSFSTGDLIHNFLIPLATTIHTLYHSILLLLVSVIVINTPNLFFFIIIYHHI